MGVVAGIAGMAANGFQSANTVEDKLKAGDRNAAAKEMTSGLTAGTNPIMAPWELFKRNVMPGYKPSWAGSVSPLYAAGEATYQSVVGKGVFTDPNKQKDADKQKDAVTPMLPTLYSEAGGTYEEIALASANLNAKTGETTVDEIYEFLHDNWPWSLKTDNPKT